MLLVSMTEGKRTLENLAWQLNALVCTSLVAQMIKNPPRIELTSLPYWVFQFLNRAYLSVYLNVIWFCHFKHTNPICALLDLLLSSVLAWRIPWTEEPGGLQSMGSQRVGHSWETSTWRWHISLPLVAHWPDLITGLCTPPLPCAEWEGSLKYWV